MSSLSSFTKQMLIKFNSLDFNLLFNEQAQKEEAQGESSNVERPVEPSAHGATPLMQIALVGFGAIFLPWLIRLKVAFIFSLFEGAIRAFATGVCLFKCFRSIKPIENKLSVQKSADQCGCLPRMARVLLYFGLPKNRVEEICQRVFDFLQTGWAGPNAIKKAVKEIALVILLAEWSFLGLNAVQSVICGFSSGLMFVCLGIALYKFGVFGTGNQPTQVA